MAVNFWKKRELFVLGILPTAREKNGSVRVYVNGEKLFTIDSNIDKEEFMEDIERRRIPVKSYWTNQHKKNRIIKVLEGLPNLLRGFREGFTIKTSIVVEGSS